MTTLAKLALTVLAATTFGTTAILAGPGPVGPTNRPGAKHIHPVKEMTCDRMVLNTPPRLGGTQVVKCVEGTKDTAACRLACR